MHIIAVKWDEVTILTLLLSCLGNLIKIQHYGPLKWGVGKAWGSILWCTTVIQMLSVVEPVLLSQVKDGKLPRNRTPDWPNSSFFGTWWCMTEIRSLLHNNESVKIVIACHSAVIMVILVLLMHPSSCVKEPSRGAFYAKKGKHSKTFCTRTPSPHLSAAISFDKWRQYILVVSRTIFFDA